MLEIVSLCAGTVSATAEAAPAPNKTPLQLTFVGAPGCDEAQTLLTEVERRSDIVSWVSDGSEKGTAQVRITSGFSRFEAEISVVRVGAPSMRRLITSSSCREAIESAALVIAVMLASSAERPSSPSSSRPVQQTQAPAAPREAWRWEFGVGASALTVFGIAPTYMVGFEEFGDLSAYRSGWAPAIRLAFRHVEQRYITLQEDVRAGFRLDSGRFNACPVAWLVTDELIARACATGHFGRLSATAYGNESRREAAHPWVGLGGGVRLEASVLSNFSVELEGACEGPLFANRFWFSGDKFHESSRATGTLGLSLVARIPR